uniref:Uncharacterized protein n=1 Tax=Cucumis melo TaxID=3656 RepID=A0A9I9DII4_CUCME
MKGPCLELLSLSLLDTRRRRKLNVAVPSVGSRRLVNRTVSVGTRGRRQRAWTVE